MLEREVSLLCPSPEALSDKHGESGSGRTRRELKDVADTSQALEKAEKIQGAACLFAETELSKWVLFIYHFL